MSSESLKRSNRGRQVPAGSGRSGAGVHMIDMAGGPVDWRLSRKVTWMKSLAVFLLLTCIQSAWAARVEGVRLWRSPDSTRIVFDLSGPVEHKLFTLQDPERVVLDLSGAALGPSVKRVALTDTPVSDIRYGVHKDNSLRVVLDLKNKTRSRSFFLARHGDKADRLVLDLFDDTKPADVTPPQAVSSDIAERRNIIIAVDAGHGGEDPGAIGPGKIREKDIVLAISRQLVDMINAEPGYEALMVRTGDYYIPLQERRNRARAKRADLFVSIHADAFTNPRAHGASVFALSSRGATSETARFLAEKENEADLIGGVGGVKLSDVDNVLAGVLVDLSMTATLGHSLDVGSRVLREMGKVTPLHKKQVEQAGFAVLKSPDVPSILVETGFISNPQEAAKLNNRNHRTALARAIFYGIHGYFYDAPPAGSLVAWKKFNSETDAHEHVIARGDTLSGIAKRYNISVQKLLSHNGLSQADVIKVGQKILIPAS